MRDTRPISISEISDLALLAQARERWERLLSLCNVQAPYLAFDWYMTALETVDADRTPLVLFFESSGADVGFVPLVYRKAHLGVFSCTVVSFISNPYTPYQAMVYAVDFEDVFGALIRHLRDKFGTSYILDLDETRLTPGEDSVLGQLGGRGLVIVDRLPKTGSRYLLLRQNFDETLDTLKGKTVKEFKRKINRLSRLGTIDLIRIRGDTEIEKHLARYFVLSDRTWKGKEPKPEFYDKLCKAFDRSGKLYFYGLTIDERPIAYLICLLGTDTIYGIKTTYHPSYYAFSPGIVLFYMAIERMFEIPGLREFDIGRGEEQFKREWTSLSHEQTRVMVYPQTLAWRAVKRIRSDVLPKMKKHRFFDSMYSAARARVLGAQIRATVEEARPARKILRTFLWEECGELARECRYSARPCRPEDIDHLAVLMSAGSLMEVKERIAKTPVILVEDGTRLAAYFCIAPGRGKAEAGAAREPLLIADWGLNEELESDRSREECIAAMMRHLHERGVAPHGVAVVFPAAREGK